MSTLPESQKKAHRSYDLIAGLDARRQHQEGVNGAVAFKSNYFKYLLLLFAKSSNSGWVPGSDLRSARVATALGRASPVPFACRGTASGSHPVSERHKPLGAPAIPYRPADPPVLARPSAKTRWRQARGSNAPNQWGRHGLAFRSLVIQAIPLPSIGRSFPAIAAMYNSMPPVMPLQLSLLCSNPRSRQPRK